jgi:hypothetical protein
MPYPRTKPYTEEQMFKDDHPGHHTICQTIRETYVMTEDPKIKENLLLVFAFGKRMHNKLKEYRKRYDDEQIEYEEET